MMKWYRIFLYLLWHWKCLCSHRVTSKYDSVPICPNHFPIQTNMFHNPTKYIFYFNDQICFSQSQNLIFFWEEIKKSLCKNASNTFVICRLWKPNCNVYICTQSCWCCTLYILRYTLYSSCTQCILAFHSDLLADDNVTFVCSFL